MSSDTQKTITMLNQIKDNLRNKTSEKRNKLILTNGTEVYSEKAAVTTTKSEETKKAVASTKSEDTKKSSSVKTRSTTLLSDTSLEIDGSVLYVTVFTILNNLLTCQDTKVFANILDRSGKIILSESEIKTIIHAIKSDISTGDIEFEYDDGDATCCGAVSTLLFRTVSKIYIGDEKFSVAEPAVYKFLTSDLSISVSTVCNR